MQLIKILYKVVESPQSSNNYRDLIEYFTQNNIPQLAEAFAHLVEKKYAPIHSNPPEQEQSK
jgi:hypothetical protein